MNRIGELEPAELDAWRRQGKRVTLLDVREADELAIAALSGALHIPLGELAERLSELPADRPIVVMCHLGGRSRRAAAFLAARGYAPVYDLAGGIDAYAEAVDPSLARY